MKNYKIHQLQLDPYGVCNAGCWFCPVRYEGNPSEGKKIMSPDLLEKIIKNLIDERNREDGIVSKGFNSFYTSHYNEILLYPHFEQLLEISQRYGLTFAILSNGTTLTPEKVDLIKKYKNVVNSIVLNIPAFDEETWSKRSGMNIKLFDKLMGNLDYAIKELYGMVRRGTFSIQVNGINEDSLTNKGGWVDLGPDFPTDMDLVPSSGELALEVHIAKETYPDVTINVDPYLYDRVGLLDNIITNKKAIKERLQKGDETKKVVGCGIGIDIGGRPIGWLHVNANGDSFLCCNDYHFDYKFGNFKTQELRDFWGGEEHIKKIEDAFENICRKCSAAIFE